MTTASNVHEFTVVGMTCGHCTNAVSSEIAKLAGVTSVDVDLESGAVRVESSVPLDRELVAAAVDEAGYVMAS
jgi:copper chaperone